jgi:hypothetical protein
MNTNACAIETSAQAAQQVNEPLARLSYAQIRLRTLNPSPLFHCR